MTKREHRTEGAGASRKLAMLEKHLEALGSVVVAYSGGVDSTFLAYVATKVLGEKALLITAASETYPQWEKDEALALASRYGWRHRTIRTSELAVLGFAENPPDRCYYCKRELYSKLKMIAQQESHQHLIDGTTTDDIGDYRPGRRAAGELDVRSPLLEAGLSKEEIRELSRMFGLETASKPAFACLASRFPYGSRITQEGLSAVEAVEAELRRMSFRQFRVRHHGKTARIEVWPEEIEKFGSDATRRSILRVAKRHGFLYVTVDLEGYRTGSLNIGLAPARDIGG